MKRELREPEKENILILFYFLREIEKLTSCIKKIIIIINKCGDKKGLLEEINCWSCT